MRITICSSEVVPFAKTGGLADVAGALPLALEKEGQEVIIVMPGYKEIQNSRFNPSTRFRIDEDISYAVIGKGVKTYFIENDKYYNRDGLYVDKNGGDFADNLDRFSYYCRRAMRLFKELEFKPDIIHVNDWQASLIPVYLKTLCKDDPFYKNTRTILTIHNIGYMGLFPKEQFSKLGLDQSLFNPDALEFFGQVNLLKGGIVFSDIINTVSPTYAKEIQTPEFGFGLEGVLHKRKNSLYGILNGLDYSLWDPATDKYLTKNYSSLNIQDKSASKQDLQKICNLPQDKDIPLFGIVSRLAEQKGFDILTEAIDSICRMHLQLVILGTGDMSYHTLLELIAKKYPKVISVHLKFDNTLAHKIYAGSDVFVMPSKYEPCGLGQLISFKYGTIPLVFKTGGLADTVNKDSGFIFQDYNKDELIKTIKSAAEAFKDKKRWPALIEKVMKYDFSWDEAAKKYIELYKKAR